jgi:hypothetical protein
MNLSQHMAQMRSAEQWAYEQYLLDQWEDVALRMFGIEVFYIMDERVLVTPTY